MLTSPDHQDKADIVAGIDKLSCMIDPARLRLLVALHERGTVHAAAGALHISTSAASQQLATLAREAGAPLTEADGRRLRLTDAGRVLVDHAYQLFAQLERAQGDVQAAVDGELGEITVGSFPSTISSLLIPAVRAVRERHPRLRVNIREVTTADGLDELASGDLDILVDVDADGAPSADDPRYTRVPLGTEDVVLALPTGHELATGQTVDLALLDGQDWVSTIDGDACDQLLRRACASVGFHPRIRHRASDWTAILAMVEAGMGVAFAPRTALTSVPGGVAVVPTSGRDVRRHVYAAVRRGAAARPAVAAYLSALEDVAAAG
ncbi:MAG: LysR family transcriptional regulator [Pseudonocardiaceae bacterium]|nr:LysR family transcriptional regulator [Pseudonocardiaceae bacterium]